MRRLTPLAVLVVTAALVGPTGVRGEGPACSTQSLAGRWVFATEVGQMPAFGGDITAIGTMNIDAAGRLSGVFDATVASAAFLPDVTYGGSVAVSGDCRGSLTFETSAGTTRTDSIVVLDRSEVWAMSRDTGNLWTYRMKRIAGPSREGQP
jgi:hypothetical protein